MYVCVYVRMRATAKVKQIFMKEITKKQIFMKEITNQSNEAFFLSE